jgi:HSP20 family protein
MSACQACYMSLLNSYLILIVQMMAWGLTQLSLGSDPKRPRGRPIRRSLCENRPMRSRIQAVVLPSEPTEFREEVRRIFRELDRDDTEGTLTGECAPALDVYETDETVEVTVDLPGVDASAVRVVAKGGTILIAGNKAPRRVRPESSFHLVERGYGRFARAIRLAVACDTSRARAALVDGELRVSIPKTADRRGRTIPITVSTGQPQA